jgi:hypothetical protein
MEVHIVWIFLNSKFIYEMVKYVALLPVELEKKYHHFSYFFWKIRKNNSIIGLTNFLCNYSYKISHEFIKILKIKIITPVPKYKRY